MKEKSNTPEVCQSDKPARLNMPVERNLLDRILNTPGLEGVVPQLPPDLVHRVIQHCGLEDCGDLVALTTTEQLARIFDLDLWRAAQPGMDEQFDADRFGIWLEVLLETGASMAAQKLAGMDADLVVTGLAHHMRVYDRAAVTPYLTLDGELVESNRAVDDGNSSEVGGYVLVARRDDSWEAIVEVLMSLEAEQPYYFHQVMQGCRAFSNSKPEIDGLHDLLLDDAQVMFDLAVDREDRREKQGYVPPPQARAFLQMSRQLQLEGDTKPTANPLARAYFRAIDNTPAADVKSDSGRLEAGPDVEPAAEEAARAVAAVFDVLFDAGVIAQPPRALLGVSDGHQPRLNRIQTQMQYLLDYNQTVHSTRSEELVYLANTLIAGCSLQARPFTEREAFDAAVAVCNLGLENWPTHWRPVITTGPPDFILVDHDLVSVFQVGWTVLHHDVSMYAAEKLIGVLKGLRCNDREIQMGLDRLLVEIAKHRLAGEPWRARDALDVIAMLDTLAWVVLLALIDECPVLHAGLGALKDSRTLSVSATDFEFISDNSQIAAVQEFLYSLPETLRS
jgi:hypothetical protein